jgi:cytochrome c oxidase subunit II
MECHPCTRRLSDRALAAAATLGRQSQRSIYFFLLFFIAGCATPATPNALDPRGPAAAEIAALWWFIFWLAVAVFVVVMILYLLAIIFSRRRDPDAPKPFAARPAFLVIAGVVVPALILIALLVASVRTTSALMTPSAVDVVTIDVVGHQWWWEVRYPEHNIVTANEIHIPAGTTIEFRVTSNDVIHSFWVPQLHGKIDMIDGKIHTIRMVASEPGTYRGICAEFCGLQHTFMALLVVAQSPEEFDSWLEQRQRAAAPPAEPLQLQGQAVYFAAGCAHCHAIQGITPPEPAIARVGPDLTHLASRQTLGAATIENNATNLAQWILNPHIAKPGVHMPASQFAEGELEALVAFLTSLE